MFVCAWCLTFQVYCWTEEGGEIYMAKMTLLHSAHATCLVPGIFKVWLWDTLCNIIARWSLSAPPWCFARRNQNPGGVCRKAKRKTWNLECTPVTTGLQVRVSRQYRSVIKDCQEQLEHLAETGAAAQSTHYLAQVFRFTFICCIFLQGAFFDWS